MHLLLCNYPTVRVAVKINITNRAKLSQASDHVIHPSVHLHVPYENIELSLAIREFINSRVATKTPSEICREIRELEHVLPIHQVLIQSGDLSLSINQQVSKYPINIKPRGP
jgi:hypothetical protein